MNQKSDVVVVVAGIIRRRMDAGDVRWKRVYNMLIMTIRLSFTFQHSQGENLWMVFHCECILTLRLSARNAAPWIDPFGRKILEFLISICDCLKKCLEFQSNNVHIFSHVIPDEERFNRVESGFVCVLIAVLLQLQMTHPGRKHNITAWRRRKVAIVTFSENNSLPPIDVYIQAIIKNDLMTEEKIIPRL